MVRIGFEMRLVTFAARNVFCVGKNYRDHVREFGRSGYDSPARSEDPRYANRIA